LAGPDINRKKKALTRRLPAVNDQKLIPPLRGLANERLQARKAHLLTEIGSDPPARRRRQMLHRPLGLRVAVVVVVVCGAIGGVLLTMNSSAPTVNSKTTARGTANVRQFRRLVHNGILALPAHVARKRFHPDEASAVLGASMVLPKTSLVVPGDSHTIWGIGECPMHPGRAREPAPACRISVLFPAQSLGVTYRSSTSAHPLAGYRSYLRDKGVNAKIIDLAGTPALMIKTSQPGRPHSRPLYWFSFVVDRIQVDVVGLQSAFALKAVARSIVVRMH
jgi:hypothetical protein